MLLLRLGFKARCWWKFEMQVMSFTCFKTTGLSLDALSVGSSRDLETTIRVAEINHTHEKITKREHEI